MKETINNIDLQFEEVIEILLDKDAPLDHRSLYRLSDLVEDELARLRKVWFDILEWRRQALLEDLELLFAADTLLSFEGVCRLAFEDPSPQIRFIALRSLQEYNVSDLIPAFIQTMKHDTDAELRAMAAANLGNYIYQGEVDRLSKEKQADIEKNLFTVIKDDESDLVRRKAFESLGYSSHKNIPDLINQAYKSGEQTWIASAVFAMGRSLDERWEAEVLKMLTHPSPEIRFEAVRAAGKLELSRALPKLLEYLATAEREIKLAAVMALSQIGGAGLQKIFEQLLVNSQSEKERRIIEEALDRLIFNQSLAVLDDLETGENWELSSPEDED